MSDNSLYETPKVLQDYILREKGIASQPYQPFEVRRHREALELLRTQWARIVDTATYGQINDLIGIRLGGNGQLSTTFAADHTFRNGVLVAVPYRFVNEAQIRRYVEGYLGWLEVSVETNRAGAVTKVIVAPSADTSRLRSRAFGQAISEARTELGSLISGQSSTSAEAPRLVVEAREVYVDGQYKTGIQVHQLYWLLAIAKEVRDNLMSLMRSALRATRADAEVVIQKRDTTESFNSFFAKRQEQLRAVATAESIESLPILNPDWDTTRSWGIEVEAAGARGVEAPGEGWVRKGDGSLRSAYTTNGTRLASECPYHDHSVAEFLDDDEEEYNDDYVDPEDCSWLTDDNEDYYSTDRRSDTAEFVSPILRKAGSPELESLVTALAREPQNDTAGVHVHVDAADLSPRNVGALVFAYSVIEPLIEQYYKRDRRNYCRERGSADVLNVVRTSKKPGVKKSYRDGDGGEIMHYGDRYVSVNLQALEAHGTVEFRAMGPVYDYAHLIKWALFCREMVSIAKLNLPAKVWTGVKTWRDVERILNTYGPELQAHNLTALEAQLETREEVTA